MAMAKLRRKSRSEPEGERGHDDGIMPAALCADARAQLSGIGTDELHELYSRLLSLPEHDPTLRVPLPSLGTPHLNGAVSALQHDDADTFAEELVTVVPMLDTPGARRALAARLIALRDEGEIDPKVAALGIIELDDEMSSFFMSAVAVSIAMRARERREESRPRIVDS